MNYAKELSLWDYEDLQRQVSRSTGQKGNALYEIAKDKAPSIVESDFIDGVSRSLANGEFLLLILGDGIRERAGAIAEYIHSSGNLDLTFGMVELALYRNQRDEPLVLPRVIAKTVVINRSLSSIKGDIQLVNAD